MNQNSCRSVLRATAWVNPFLKHCYFGWQLNLLLVVAGHSLAAKTPPQGIEGSHQSASNTGEDLAFNRTIKLDHSIY